MDIDVDTLNIPDTDYDARVTLPSSEFSRIVRDLSQLGESVRIEVSKEGVRFASEGEAANGNILLRHTDTSGVNGKKGGSSKVKDEDDEDAINSDLDDSDEDGQGQMGDDDDEPGDQILCTYDKVQRVKNKWKCVLKDGVMSTGGKEWVFHKGTGEFEW